MAIHRIAQASNTVVPAILALETLGYTITIEGDLMFASSTDATFVADDPLALLGLVRLVETRTWAWEASDDEIDQTLARYEDL